MADTEETLQQELDHASLRDEFETDAGIRNLGRLVGLHSLNRNLKSEDAEVARIERACNNVLFEQPATDALKEADKAMSDNPTEDGMGDILAGKSVTINNFYGEKAAEAGTAVAATASSPADAASAAPTASPMATPSPEKTLDDIMLTDRLAQLQKQLERVAAQKPTIISNVPSWMKTAIIATAVGAPLTSIAAAYLLRPSPPAPYGLEVLEGISTEKDSLAPQ